MHQDPRLTDIGVQLKQSTPTGAAYAEICRNALATRRVPQFNDRQVLPASTTAHIEANGGATVAGDRCVRRCAWRTARPSRLQFVSRTLTRRREIMIDLIRRFARERRVRATLIVPFREKCQLTVECLPTSTYSARLNR